MVRTMDSAASNLALTAPPLPLERVVQRARAEFCEMPGLSLTRDQARRLWGLDPSTCDAALAELVAAQFLRLTSHGSFVRNHG